MKEELFVSSATNICGKIIAAATINCSRWVVLRFTDGTYTALKAATGYDGDMFLEYSSDVPPELLLDVGVLSKEEFEAMREEEERQRKEFLHWNSPGKEFGSPAETKPEEEK